ncbi:putative 3-hydroxyisobutyrate dehydrogenase, mitochondrial [Mycena venus]|uniref:3-hydroxyisobutyrate dehydrogenase n=1 Tax=Mycena venus TaxID=2733690 RepID=A0A8H6YMW0_9AGAR|nr:putative 3-hydroxyisobutyrate dehydrogenase, mitochondrial [Mycena venus]
MAVDLPKRFGWVGLGAMGWPMATQLLKNSTAELLIFDVDQPVLHRFASEAPDGRVQIATSSKQVADESEDMSKMFTCRQKLDYWRETRPERSSSTGKAWQCSQSVTDQSSSSTIDIETSLAVGEAVRTSDPENPAIFLDCPVSGGTAGAAKGIITFMCGIAADDEMFPLLHAILKNMGRSINPMGGRGLGLAAKLSNNYLSGIIALATSEAMNLGMKLGIDPKVLSDCFNEGSAANWVNSTVNPVPGVCPEAVTSKCYEGGFKVQLMEKDMKLASAAAQNVGARLVLGETAIGAYTSAAADPRYRGKDSRVVYKWLVGGDPGTDNA